MRNTHSITAVIPKAAEAYLYDGWHVVGEVEAVAAWCFYKARIPSGSWLMVARDQDSIDDYIEQHGEQAAGEHLAHRLTYQADRIASGWHASWWRVESPEQVVWYVPLRTIEWIADSMIGDLLA